MAPKAKIAKLSNATPSDHLRGIVKPLAGFQYSLNDFIKAYLEATGKIFDEDTNKMVYGIFGKSLFETQPTKFTEAHIEYKVIEMPERGVSKQITNYSYDLSEAIANKSLLHSTTFIFPPTTSLHLDKSMAQEFESHLVENLHYTIKEGEKWVYQEY